MQNRPGGVVQRHPGLHELVLAAHDPQVVVARAQRVRHLEQVRQDGSRLKSLQGVLHNIWVLRQHSDQVLGVWLGKKTEVGR